jgi:GNAT superfamily N-acetyltransferase
MDIEIRRAVETDAETVLALIDALAQYERMDPLPPDGRERIRQDLFGPRPRIEAHLAFLNEQAVGYTITLESYSSFLARPTLYLEDLFVLPEYRRHGVGRVFFRFLAAEALRRGCGRMEWAVLTWNQLAIDFYEKLGARRLEEWLVYRLDSAQLAGLAAE